MTKPPKFSWDGSQTTRVKKENPYFSMAGIAPLTNDSKIPASMANVRRTAPSDAQPNSRSNKPLAFRDDVCDVVFIDRVKEIGGVEII